MSDEIPTVIDCVDCGGRCHLVGYLPDEPLPSGFVLTYRCADCNDRWDMIWEPET